VVFKARYRGLGPSRKLGRERLGTLEYFLNGALLPLLGQWIWADYPGNLHHALAPEEVKRRSSKNDLAAVLAKSCPNLEPVLHYSRQLASISGQRSWCGRAWYRAL